MMIGKGRIVEVYSGKPGCMCGCRGTYSTKPAQITRVYNKMMTDQAGVMVEDNLAYLLTESKYYVVFFKEETK